MSGVPYTLDRELIAVLGMHRSVTSALTEPLSCLGVLLGNVLVEPRFYNSKSFFERAENWQLDYEPLKVLGSDRDDPGPLSEDWLGHKQTAVVAERISEICDSDFASAGLAAVKDPRMCRVVSLWRNPPLESQP